MHISQNSSAFCDVRCVIARAAKIENGRSRREAFDERRRPLSANDVEETITASCHDKAFKFDDNSFGCVTASAVLTIC